MNWKPILRATLALLFSLSAIAGDAPGVVRRIKPNDIIAIHVLGEAELTMDRRVPADGKMAFPFLKEIEVGDKTTGEVEKAIRDGLHPDWIINPQVTVEVKDFVKQFVIVNGQVNAPGPVELPPDRRITLLEALNKARDFTPKANKKRIELNRKGFAKPKVYTYDELKKETDDAKKIYVEADDVVDVGESIL